MLQQKALLQKSDAFRQFSLHKGSEYESVEGKVHGMTLLFSSYENYINFFSSEQDKKNSGIPFPLTHHQKIKSVPSHSNVLGMHFVAEKANAISILLVRKRQSRCSFYLKF